MKAKFKFCSIPRIYLIDRYYIKTEAQETSASSTELIPTSAYRQGHIG